jgi:hypothetical protein
MEVCRVHSSKDPHIIKFDDIFCLVNFRTRNICLCVDNLLYQLNNTMCRPDEKVYLLGIEQSEIRQMALRQGFLRVFRLYTLQCHFTHTVCSYFIHVLSRPHNCVTNLLLSLIRYIIPY